MDAVAQALADPIRREILRMVRKAPRSAGAIASAFSVSRPAVSRHLRVLRESGLVHDEIVGRERLYRLDARPLAELAQFVEEIREPCDPRAEWERRFLALDTEVHRVRAQRKRASAEVTTARSNKKERAA